IAGTRFLAAGTASANCHTRMRHDIARYGTRDRAGPFPAQRHGIAVVVMPSGAAVETATIGRAGVVGASAGLGARWAVARAIVQFPGTGLWLSATRFREAANQSPPMRDLLVRYNDLLFSQVQQSVACNALHDLEARLARWLLQTQDCCDSDALPLTQEFLGQM